MPDLDRDEVQRRVKALDLTPEERQKGEYVAVLAVAMAEALGATDEELLEIRWLSVTPKTPNPEPRTPAIALAREYVHRVANVGMSRESALSEIRGLAYDPKWVNALVQVEALVQPITG